MKKIISSIIIVPTALLLSTAVWAQPGMGKPNKPQQTQNEQMHPQCKKECQRDRMGFEDLKLSDEQKTKIKDLKTAQMKESMKLRNKMEELRAHLKTLSTADATDMKAINATIDEITQTQNQLMKSRETFKQQIRGLLTDEQRVEFDLRENNQHRHQRNERMHPGFDDKGE